MANGLEMSSKSLLHERFPWTLVLLSKEEEGGGSDDVDAQQVKKSGLSRMLSVECSVCLYLK